MFQHFEEQIPKIQGRRKVWKSGGLVVLGGDNVPPLVEIGLTDLPKTEGAEAPPAPPCDRPALYPHPKHLFGIGSWIWAAKN